METKTYILELTDADLVTLRAWSGRLTRGIDTDPAISFDAATGLKRLARELEYARPRSLEELVSFGEDRLREDYFGDVRLIAEESLSSVLSSETDESDAREAIEERIWESVDGSQWVIYTGKAQDVLRVSSNDGYTLDNFGSDGIVSDGAIDWSKLAFGAMYADVSEHAWADFENWKDLRDSFESDLLERDLSLDDVKVRDSGESFADRFLVSITLPDGVTEVHYSMSSDATSVGGVEEPGPEEQGASIVGPDVPDAVREQVLRIVDTLRAEADARILELRTSLAHGQSFDPAQLVEWKRELESICETWNVKE